jgi:hypothetical protein
MPDPQPISGGSMLQGIPLTAGTEHSTHHRPSS